MKKLMNILGALTIAAALTAGFTACSNEDNLTSEQPAVVKTYTVSIPASFDEGSTRAVSFDNSGATPTISSTFATTEKVYVFNVTTGKMLSGYLSPTNISGDGKKCDLTGTLTGTINAGNELKLFYNMSYYYDPVYYEPGVYDNTYNYFSYIEQDGTAEGVLDGAIATGLKFVEITGGVLSTDVKASFQNLQSMFRFQFQNEISSPITVKSLRIFSNNRAFAAEYHPFEYNPYGVGDLYLTPNSPINGYLYMALCINESSSDGDVLTFTVVDNNDKVYQGTKTAPNGGFKNGKYYYNTAPITLTYQYDLTSPTISWTKVGSNDRDFFIDSYRYYVSGTNGDTNDINFTLSGTSKGYYFILNNGGRVTLNGITAQYDYFDFLLTYSDLTLNINGTNSVTCLKCIDCIYANTLKLSGSGTLTVTANNLNCCGLIGETNYDYLSNNWETTTQVDVSSQLAASGYRVTRSARVDGPDNNGDSKPDYYTWTYTVAPN